MRQIDVTTESMLLISFGSGVSALTDAVFVMVPAEVGLTTMSTVATAPFAIDPREHVTVPIDSSQLPWLGAAFPKPVSDVYIDW
jgi:hypothetical protein